MSNIWWKSLLFSPCVLGVILVSVTSSIAASTPKNTKISELQATQTRAFVTLSKQIFVDKQTVSVAQTTAISTKYPAVMPGRIPATSPQRPRLTIL